MAQVTGVVVKVAIDTPVLKKDGGSYPGWKLVYEDASGEVKTIAKHMNSLKYAAALANGLKALQPGDAFTLEQEKEGEFWNPKNIYKGVAPSQAPTNAPAASKAPTQQAKAFTLEQEKEGDTAASKAPTQQAKASTYSTAAERAQTQVYIIRQSSLTNALKLLEIIGNKKVNVDDVIAVAGVFEEWVTTGKNPSSILADLKDDSEYVFDDVEIN